MLSDTQRIFQPISSRVYPSTWNVHRLQLYCIFSCTNSSYVLSIAFLQNLPVVLGRFLMFVGLTILGTSDGVPLMRIPGAGALLVLFKPTSLDALSLLHRTLAMSRSSLDKSPDSV